MKGERPRAWLDGRHIRVSALGRMWLLDHSQPLEDLWERMSEKDLADERIPYWAELWPASLVLAQHLAERAVEIRSRLCLDLGCGLGLTTLIGRKLGAFVLGCDYSPAALACAARNAALNGMAPGRHGWLAMDWRQPAIARGAVWRLWAADILYEKRSFAPVLDFLEHALAPGGAAWIGEPGRSIFESFKSMAAERGWLLAPVFRGEAMSLYAGQPAAQTCIWQMEKRP